MTAELIDAIEPERRVLDRVDANVWHKDGMYEVRAGESRVDGLTLFQAHLLCDAHNESLINQRFAESRRHDGGPVDLANVTPIHVERQS